MAKAEKPPMASASSKMGGLALFVPLLGPVTLAAASYAAWKIHWALLLKEFFTGPGRGSRICMLLFAVFNWKNLPFAWTVRPSHSLSTIHRHRAPCYSRVLRPCARFPVHANGHVSPRAASSTPYTITTS